MVQTLDPGIVVVHFNDNRFAGYSDAMKNEIGLPSDSHDYGIADNYTRRQLYDYYKNIIAHEITHHRIGKDNAKTYKELGQIPREYKLKGFNFFNEALAYTGQGMISRIRLEDAITYIVGKNDGTLRRSAYSGPAFTGKEEIFYDYAREKQGNLKGDTKKIFETIFAFCSLGYTAVEAGELIQKYIHELSNIDYQDFDTKLTTEQVDILCKVLQKEISNTIIKFGHSRLQLAADAIDENGLPTLETIAELAKRYELRSRIRENNIRTILYEEMGKLQLEYISHLPSPETYTTTHIDNTMTIHILLPNKDGSAYIVEYTHDQLSNLMNNIQTPAEITHLKPGMIQGNSLRDNEGTRTVLKAQRYMDGEKVAHSAWLFNNHGRKLIELLHKMT